VSVAFAKVRGRVRARLHETGAHKDPLTAIDIDMAIAESWILMGSFLPSPVFAISSAFTISAGATTFTLPVSVASSGYGTGTTEYDGEVRIQLVSNASFLQKITAREMDAFLSGSTTPPQAVPDRFALYPDKTQIVQGRCWPAAKVAEACNLWASISAEDLRDYVGTGGAEGIDTATVNGSRKAVQALIARSARYLLTTMTPTAAEARGIDKNALLAKLDGECAALEYDEEQTVHSIRSTGRQQRWTA